MGTKNAKDKNSDQGQDGESHESSAWRKNFKSITGAVKNKLYKDHTQDNNPEVYDGVGQQRPSLQHSQGGNSYNNSEHDGRQRENQNFTRLLSQQDSASEHLLPIQPNTSQGAPTSPALPALTVTNHEGSSGLQMPHAGSPTRRQHDHDCVKSSSPIADQFLTSSNPEYQPERQEEDHDAAQDVVSVTQEIPDNQQFPTTRGANRSSTYPRTASESEGDARATADQRPSVPRKALSSNSQVPARPPPPLSLEDRVLKQAIEVAQENLNPQNKDHHDIVRRTVGSIISMCASALSMEKNLAGEMGDAGVQHQELARLESENEKLHDDNVYMFNQKQALERSKKAMVDELQEKVRQLIESNSKNRELETKLSSIEPRHKTEMNKLKKGQKAEIDKALDKLGKTHREQMSKKESNHNTVVSDLRMQLGEAESDKTVMTTVHRTELVELGRKHRAEIDRWKNEHAQEIKDLEEAHSEAVKDVERVRTEVKQKQERTEADHAAEVKDLTGKHNVALAKARQDNEESEKKLIAAHQEVAGQLQKRIDDDRVGHEADRKALKDDHTTKLNALISDHDTQMESQRQSIRELNAILLNRDEDGYKGSLFKPLGLPTKPDEQLRNLFGEIMSSVDRLGRSANSWKADQPVWTEEVLRRIQGDHVPRILKKAIIQDMVWTLLYQDVFGSPFRIFGEEGRALENEWFQECKQDPPTANDKKPWPAPGPRAERWRYMTMNECREALTKKFSEYDARTRLRNGFSSSLEHLGKNLKEQMSSMVEMTEENLQLVDRLPKKAAAVWLDFEMHRCRIVVQNTGSDLQSSKAKMEQTKQESLVLTVSPELGRWGTVKGTELDTFIFIDGCGGDSLTVNGV